MPTPQTAFSRDFAEDADFERFVLDRLGTHRVRVAEATSIHDTRGTPASPTGNIRVLVGAAVTGTTLRDELAASLRPLGFGAAYKVLDQLIEHVLRANGAGAGRLTFQRKVALLARRPRTLPPPLDARPELWDCLAALYVGLVEPRHAVTHRRAQVTATGDLEIYDGRPTLIDTVSAEEIQAFAAAVHATAEAIIDGDPDPRRLNIIAWHLNVLEPRHRRGLLTATDPNAHRRLLQMDLADVGDGSLRFDVARAQAVVDGQEPSVWDVELYAGDRVFVGHWEDMPSDQAEVEFHPASPPPWLSEVVQSQEV